jgi:purine-binding chemotaxis protein CheW
MSPAGAALKQIVTFRLGEDLFAADIFAVDRVVRYSEPRAIPNVPAWIEGVIEYQSRTVPVVDLRRRFEIGGREIASGTRLLILAIEGDFVAAIVDEVLDVTPLPAGKLSNPPGVFRGLSAEYLVGVLKRDDRLVVVLDFARIFSSNDRIVFEKVGRENTGG